MIRCPPRGIRLADAAPHCPTHGLAPASASSELPPLAAPELQPTAALEPLGYRIDGVLGRGGFGVVYAAERTSDGRRVAGLARPIGADPPDLERSADRDDIGTAESMSPEQCNGLFDAERRNASTVDVAGLERGLHIGRNQRGTQHAARKQRAQRQLRRVFGWLVRVRRPW